MCEKSFSSWQIARTNWRKFQFKRVSFFTFRTEIFNVEHFFREWCIKIMRKRDVCEFLIGRFSCPCYLPNYIRKKPFHGTFFSCQNNFCEEDCNWQRKSVFILVATKYEKWTKKKSLLSCMKDSCTTQQLFNQLVTYTATDLFIKLVGSIKENKRKRRITEFALKTSFFCEFRSRFY